MKFSLIYADPPWSYDKNTGRGAAANHYPVMSIWKIAALDVEELAEKNAVLLMWATFPKLEEAFLLMKAWGFEYKTVAFTWIKTNSDGTPFIGLGHHTRSNAEIVLLGTKGKGLPVMDHSISQVVKTKIGKHSAKPHGIYNLIERLYGEVSRVELFARHQREGWAVWGNQAPAEQQKILTKGGSND